MTLPQTRNLFATIRAPHKLQQLAVCFGITAFLAREIAPEII